MFCSIFVVELSSSPYTILFFSVDTHIYTGKFVKMMATFWMYSVLCSMFVLAAPQDTCPTEWFTAEFTVVNNQLVDASAGAGQLADTNGSFFRNVLGFTASQLAAEVQRTRDYFNTRFGLNFPELDASGQAQFENATLSYFQIPFTHYVTINRWIVTGDTRSRCIEAFNGGLQVTFSATQILRGTYGGTTGRTIPAGESLLYGYYRIDTCPQQPLLIQYESINPSRSTADGYFVNDNRIFTPTLGTGFEIVVFRLEPNFNGNPNLIP